MATRFGLLGEVEATVDGEPADLGHARQRTVLAALLIEPNRPVSTGVLADRVWGDRIPSSAQSSLHSYVSRLRKVLAGADDVSLSRQSGGYLVRVDPENVDVHEFRALVAAATGEDAASRLERALGLWRGRPFGDIDTPWLDQVRDELERERFAAELDHNDIRLRGDGHGSLLARLSTLASAHPTDERVAGQLMLALWKSGRQADALTHFDRLRRRFAQELGIDPGKALRDLHQRILVADSKPEPDRRAPAQLPADAAHFTGRASDLAELTRAVQDHDVSRVTICAIEGTPGVGKTALAVRFAHRAADAFPDGQLFLNLRGYGLDVPIPAEAALATLLHGVGVDGGHIPAGLDARAALWRTQTAGRRLVILLDNAADSTQIRPLLPGPGSVVIVTSRARLRGLAVREGARQLRLDRMPADDALEMLRSIVGADRVAEQPTEAKEILDVCARLPLAIRILGERTSFDPALDLAGLLDELGDEKGRLAAFDLEDDEDSDLRSVFLHSYKALDEPTACLFRLLGAQNVADFTVASAAAAGGITDRDATVRLDELVTRHLVEQPNPGRYQFHDLMRDFARTLGRETDSPETIRVSTRRLLGYYLSALTAAGTLMNAKKTPLTLPNPTDVRDTSFLGLEQAIAWCDDESQNIVTLVTNTHDANLLDYVMRFPKAIFDYMVARAHKSAEWIALHAHARAAAATVGMPDHEMLSLNGLAVAHSVSGDHDAAIMCLEDMLRIARATSDTSRKDISLNNLAVAHLRAGNPDQSLRYGMELLNSPWVIGDPRNEGSARATIASAYLQGQNYDDAIEHARKALPLCRAVGMRLAVASACHTIASALAGKGDLASSVAEYELALAAYRELDVTYLEGDTLLELGDVHHRRGADGAARECWQAALDLFERTDSPRSTEALSRLRGKTNPSGAQEFPPGPTRVV